MRLAQMRDAVDQVDGIARAIEDSSPQAAGLVALAVAHSRA
jgi:hypothetical protein